MSTFIDRVILGFFLGGTEDWKVIPVAMCGCVPLFCEWNSLGYQLIHDLTK
jgi:hypothetical protein